MSETKAAQIDIFQVLNKINANDFEYYSTLEEHEQKAVVPFVLMKWMRGTNKTKHVLRLNARANAYMFSLGQHKELLYKLLCSVADGRQTRYQWIKGASNKKGSTSLTLQVIAEYYGFSKREAEESLPLLSKDDILEMAEYLGRQTDELTKLKAELKTTKGNG